VARPAPEASALAPRTVVVTGLGTTNPLGGDVPTTWQALREGRCAVRELDEDWVATHELPVRIGARPPPPAPPSVWPPLVRSG